MVDLEVHAKLNATFFLFDRRVRKLHVTEDICYDEIFMRQETKNLLAIIGLQLDGLSFPVVMNRGIVMPGQFPVPINSSGKENQNERKKARRPTTGARPRAEGGARTSCKASPFVVAVDAAYEKPLASVHDAYPDAQVWQQEDGFWVTVGAVLLPKCERRARLLVGVSESYRTIRAWAFWDGGVVGSTWIGPRHTNFPDGSICAFDVSDGTWQFGDSLVELLDLYVLWVLRHLHQEVLGRWPGPQSVPLLYERLLEVNDSELCGCDNPVGIYADCCKSKDSEADLLRAAFEFGRFTHWALRYPPPAVTKFMREGKEPPPLHNVI